MYKILAAAFRNAFQLDVITRMTDRHEVDRQNIQFWKRTLREKVIKFIDFTKIAKWALVQGGTNFIIDGSTGSLWVNHPSWVNRQQPRPLAFRRAHCAHGMQSAALRGGFVGVCRSDNPIRHTQKHRSIGRVSRLPNARSIMGPEVNSGRRNALHSASSMSSTVKARASARPSVPICCPNSSITASK